MPMVWDKTTNSWTWVPDDGVNTTAVMNGQVKNGFDTSYHAGDILSGRWKAANQAAAQAQLNAQQQAFNSAEADKNRAWEEHMRDTSITSTAQQYQALGINPLAGIAGGQGVVSTASTAATAGNGQAAAPSSSDAASIAATAAAIAKIVATLA